MSDTQYLAVVRHGQSEANVNLVTTTCGLYYSLCGSDVKVPLTKVGRHQADKAGKKLARIFPRPSKADTIYHGEHLRVVHSASLVQRRLPYKSKLISDARLNKRSYGRFWNLTHRGVETLHNDEWQRYLTQGDIHYRAPDSGENYPDLFARVDAFIDDVVMPLQGNIIAVVSSAPMLAFQRRFEGLSDDEVIDRYEQVALPNAHILLYSRLSGQSQFTRCA